MQCTNMHTKQYHRALYVLIMYWRRECKYFKNCIEKYGQFGFPELIATTLIQYLPYKNLQKFLKCMMLIKKIIIMFCIHGNIISKQNVYYLRYFFSISATWMLLSGSYTAMV